MKILCSGLTFVGALLVLPAIAAPGREHGAGHVHEGVAYGSPGDPGKPARIVQVVMREEDGRMLFLPDVVRIKRGEQVRFLLRNNGAIEHEFVIGTLEENLRHQQEMQDNAGMLHDEPNARRVAAKATGEVIWRFTKDGEFDYSCLIPGHREAGMFGRIVVE